MMEQQQIMLQIQIQSGSLWFHSKDETTGSNNNIANTDDIKSFKYKIKLLDTKAGQPAPNNANGILKDTAIAAPLKYLSNFWRSLELPLINCKVKCKLEWTKYCVLPAAGTDNTNTSPHKIIFTVKDIKLYVPVATSSFIYFNGLELIQNKK